MNDDLYRTRHDRLPRLDEAGLIEYFKTQRDVAAAYLFGSMAIGKAHPESDIDIALLVTQLPDDPFDALGRRMELASAIERFADREVDVAILNLAEPIFANQVLAHGKRLYEGDRAARVRFEVAVGLEYADYKPTFDYFARVMVKEIKEGRFGERRRPRGATAPAA